MTLPIQTVEAEDGERHMGRFVGRAEDGFYVFSDVDEEGRFTLVMLHEARFRIVGHPFAP